MSAKFRQFVEQVTAALEDKGISVAEPGVSQLLEYKAREIANQLGISVSGALQYVDPAQFAASVAETVGRSGIPVRPPRDEVAVPVKASRIPFLISGLAEAGKQASANNDGWGTGVALDLISQLALSLHETLAEADTSPASQTRTAVERGALIEAASIMTTASERLSAGDWSVCPCGDDHGQAEVGRKLAAALVSHAREIDQFLALT